jgi:hypothetical protein
MLQTSETGYDTLARAHAAGASGNTDFFSDANKAFDPPSPLAIPVPINIQL